MNHAATYIYIPAKSKPMPLVSAALTIPVLATAFALPAAALVIEEPRRVDAYAILGAILASLIALIEARYKGKDFRLAMTNFMACAIAGSLAPKMAFLMIVQWGWIAAENPLVRAWETWAAAGFMLGMNGWWLIHKASALIKGAFPKDRD